MGCVYDLAGGGASSRPVGSARRTCIGKRARMTLGPGMLKYRAGGVLAQNGVPTRATPNSWDPTSSGAREGTYSSISERAPGARVPYSSASAPWPDRLGYEGRLSGARGVRSPSLPSSPSTTAVPATHRRPLISSCPPSRREGLLLEPGSASLSCYTLRTTVRARNGHFQFRVHVRLAPYT